MKFVEQTFEQLLHTQKIMTKFNNRIQSHNDNTNVQTAGSVIDSQNSEALKWFLVKHVNWDD